MSGVAKWNGAGFIGIYIVKSEHMNTGSSNCSHEFTLVRYQMSCIWCE